VAGRFNYWLGDFSIGAIPIHILYRATAVPRYGTLLKVVGTKKWNFTRHEPQYLLVSSVLRRVRRIAKGDCSIRHVFGSFRPHGTARLALDGFS